ncbi:MAG: RidA family protein [Verrucomicrobiae bacterium]|nr:RidA family protein [Verrucomicrobiae bacterium]
MSLPVTNPGAAPATEPAIRTDELLSLTFRPQPNEEIPGLCRRLAQSLHTQGATLVHLLVYGKVGAHSATLDALRSAFGRLNFPITWVEGAACDGSPVAGMQAYAFTGDVERIESGGRVIGSIFTEGGARQCLLGGLTPAGKTLPPAAQTTEVLENLQTILRQAGFELADIVRTWFFLENILSWYDDFNPARTKIYSGVKFRSGSAPASTGVGAKNPDGTALMLAAWAVRPLNASTQAKEIASPLQCPAPAYNSTFSRAMEIASSSGRRLFISGTASIAHGGKTLWVGDVRKQIELTMDVVEAILRSRGLTFADLTRATAYFRHSADAQFFVEWLAANPSVKLAIPTAQCDVCRDDLLFELEADAEMKI